MRTNIKEKIIFTFLIAVLLVALVRCPPPTREDRESLFERQEPMECEKPCCHLLHNRYCIECNEYRDNN